MSAIRRQIVDRKRFGSSGSYVAGKYVASAPIITLGIKASVQPPRSRNSQMALDATNGAKLSDIIIIYCEVNTFQGDDDRNNTKADHVVFNGSDYEVKQISPRTGTRLRHDKVYAARLAS